MRIRCHFRQQFICLYWISVAVTDALCILTRMDLYAKEFFVFFFFLTLADKVRHSWKSKLSLSCSLKKKKHAGLVCLIINQGCGIKTVTYGCVCLPACPQQSAPLGLFLNTYLHKFYECVSSTKHQRLKLSICNLYTIELISGTQSGTDWQDTPEEEFSKFTNWVLKGRNGMIHLFEGEKAVRDKAGIQLRALTAICWKAITMLI